MELLNECQHWYCFLWWCKIMGDWTFEIVKWKVFMHCTWLIRMKHSCVALLLRVKQNKLKSQDNKKYKTLMSWFSLQINQNNRSHKLDEACRRLGICSQGMGCLSPISEVWKSKSFSLFFLHMLVWILTSLFKTMQPILSSLRIISGESNSSLLFCNMKDNL